MIICVGDPCLTLNGCSDFSCLAYIHSELWILYACSLGLRRQSRFTPWAFPFFDMNGHSTLSWKPLRHLSRFVLVFPSKTLTLLPYLSFSLSLSFFLLSARNPSTAFYQAFPNGRSKAISDGYDHCVCITLHSWQPWVCMEWAWHLWKCFRSNP